MREHMVRRPLHLKFLWDRIGISAAINLDVFEVTGAASKEEDLKRLFIFSEVEVSLEHKSIVIDGREGRDVRVGPNANSKAIAPTFAEVS